MKPGFGSKVKHLATHQVALQPIQPYSEVVFEWALSEGHHTPKPAPRTPPPAVRPPGAGGSSTKLSLFPVCTSP